MHRLLPWRVLAVCALLAPVATATEEDAPPGACPEPRVFLGSGSVVEHQPFAPFPVDFRVDPGARHYRNVTWFVVLTPLGTEDWTRSDDAVVTRVDGPGLIPPHRMVSVRDGVDVPENLTRAHAYAATLTWEADARDCDGAWSRHAPEDRPGTDGIALVHEGRSWLTDTGPGGVRRNASAPPLRPGQPLLVDYGLVARGPEYRNLSWRLWVDERHAPPVGDAEVTLSVNGPASLTRGGDVTFPASTRVPDLPTGTYYLGMHWRGEVRVADDTWVAFPWTLSDAQAGRLKVDATTPRQSTPTDDGGAREDESPEDHSIPAPGGGALVLLALAAGAARGARCPARSRTRRARRP